jgi:metal-responsive CopG/Arc/MetJ family transcriptional regulator
MARKPESSTKPKKPSRSERLAAALRENLRRRKAQERQRGAATPDKSG